MDLLKDTMSVKLAKLITGGGITKVSKMPCMTYNLPASACKVGSQLRARGRAEIATTGDSDIPCAHCYAEDGNFLFPSVQRAMELRLASLAHPRWTEAMAYLINTQSPLYFRWHSSGDIQSPAHFARICEICRLTPATQHWIPTQERKVIGEYLRLHGAFPANLCVRISAVKLGTVHGTYTGDPHRQASMVSRTPITDGHNCPAPRQGNRCGSCRACWRKDVPLVAYHLH